MEYRSYINSYYAGVSYYCQYANTYINCGDKKCSDCSYKAKHKKKYSKEEAL